MPANGTVAEHIINQLGAWGVRTIFGLPGDSIFGLMDAIRKNRDVTFCVCHHEETAAFMASAHAKLTGEIGVCLADGGPGTVHLMNGVYDAYNDHVPLLAITGQVAEKWLGTHCVQAMDESALFGDVTGFTATITSPQQAPKVLEAAFKKAYCMGVPVHLGLAKDVQSMPAAMPINQHSVIVCATPKIDEKDIDRAADILSTASKPMLLVGRPSRGQAESVTHLARTLGAGIVNTLPAKGAIPETDGIAVGCVGYAGNQAARDTLGQADAVLILGSTWWPPEPKGATPSKARVVQVDLRPDRIGGGNQVELGIVGDIRDFLPLLQERLDGKKTRGASGDWPQKVAEAVKRRDDWITKAARPDGLPLHPAVVIKAIEDAVPEDGIIGLDTSDLTLWFGAHFRGIGHDVVLSGMWRTMGYGLPAAMAAKLARPEKKVLCLCGDGGLNMVLADLATAVKYKLGITVVVANNGEFALEANKQKMDGYPYFAQEFLNPDFAGVARGMGAKGHRLEKPGELSRLIADGLAGDEPVLIDVPTRRVPPPEIARSL